MTASQPQGGAGNADFLRGLAGSERPGNDSAEDLRKLRALAACLDELQAGFDDLTATGDSRRMLLALASLFDGE